MKFLVAPLSRRTLTADDATPLLRCLAVPPFASPPVRSTQWNTIALVSDLSILPAVAASTLTVAFATLRD